jgi:hypothetical protein
MKSSSACPAASTRSVAAALIHRAIGDQLTCVFVDHGLLRKDEGKMVMDMFAKNLGVKVLRIDATDQFMGHLAGVNDPEQKRKIIGREFVEVFQAQAKQADGRALAGAGHDLSGRDRIGRQGQEGPDHQEPPQRGRPAGNAEPASCWNRCANCSRTKCASWAWPWACRTTWCTVIRSRVRAWACVSSAK